MQFSVQKALVHMNKISESGHSQVALSIKRTSICCECQLPSDLNRFASQLRSCVQKGWGCWTGDKSKYGARCITASAEPAEEEQRRARHGFSTARSPENRRMSQIWRLNVTSSKPKKREDVQRFQRTVNNGAISINFSTEMRFNSSLLGMFDENRKAQ